MLIDDRGRIFGKVNIIDAAVLVVACLLIPLAYGAYLLFRAPQPRIVAIEPARAPQGATEVNLRGENLRPYLRATIGTQQAGLLFQSADTSVVRLPPELPPGEYDVVLYDEAQELGRLTRGLVIESTSSAISAVPAASAQPEEVPKGDILAIGTFRGLRAEDARALAQQLTAIRSGTSSWGRVLGSQPLEKDAVLVKPDEIPVLAGTYRIKAVIRMQCALSQGDCRVRDTVVTAGAVVPLDISGRDIRFVVEEVHPVYDSRLEIRIRTTVPPEMAAVLRDGQQTLSPAFPARDALRPSIASIDPTGTTDDGRQTLTISVGVPALSGPDGWRYGRRALRLGSDFSLETPLYVFNGPILSIREVGTPPAAP